MLMLMLMLMLRANDIRAEGQKSATQIRYTKAQLHRLNTLACAAGGALLEAPCIALHAGEELDSEFRQLAVLARDAKVRGDDNYILRRGALLHGDVAVLAPHAMIDSTESSSYGGPRRFRDRAPARRAR